jgi:hypothetical protein
MADFFLDNEIENLREKTTAEFGKFGQESGRFTFSFSVESAIRDRIDGRFRREIRGQPIAAVCGSRSRKCFLIWSWKSRNAWSGSRSSRLKFNRMGFKF